jgi:hypothetical protein
MVPVHVVKDLISPPISELHNDVSLTFHVFLGRDKSLEVA